MGEAGKVAKFQRVDALLTNLNFTLKTAGVLGEPLKGEVYTRKHWWP